MSTPALPPNEDLTENWVLDCNDAADGEDPIWLTICETWFTEDDTKTNEQVDQKERELTKAGKIEEIVMTPRPFGLLFERFKELRPDQEEWEAYRFRNVTSGDILLAWLFKS